jgi:hypothetical protein
VSGTSHDIQGPRGGKSRSGLGHCGTQGTFIAERHTCSSGRAPELLDRLETLDRRGGLVVELPDRRGWVVVAVQEGPPLLLLFGLTELVRAVRGRSVLFMLQLRAAGRLVPRQNPGMVPLDEVQVARRRFYGPGEP